MRDSATTYGVPLVSVWWEPRVPAEVRAAVEPIVERNLSLLPTWCHELVVKYDPDNENNALMYSEPEARRAHLTVTGWFLRADADERRSSIRHEFCHTLTQPLTDWTKDLIERLAGDDGRLREWLHSEWRERLEGVTCDLERSFRHHRAP